MRLRSLIVAATLLAAPMSAASRADDDDDDLTPAPEGAKAYIVNLKDGQTLKSPFTVVFGLKGMGIAPAGVDHPKTGHHHIFINTELTEDMIGYPIPADSQHIHFGGGQSEVSLALAPGTYTLRLVLGDQNHIPHKPPVVSKAVTVTVVD